MAPVIEYAGKYDFALSPETLWETIEHLDRFAGRWGWLEEFRLEGDGLAAGSVLHGVVAPPLPYRMRIRVEIVDSERYRSIDADVHGDLEGESYMRTRSNNGGTSVDIGWTVEMMQRPMRLADRVAHPLLQWGHDRVVETTLRNLPATFGYPGS